MNRPLAISALAVLLGPLGLLAGCANKYEKQEQQIAEMPVNCAYAKGDLRMLRSEKANAMQQLEAGVASIDPIAVMANMSSPTGGGNAQVATGEYNRMIDDKIMLIQQTCNIQ